ncbi:hypothetical protein EC973_005281 [Apophysomyces ossiformis]|uniref:Uncharacterized protein n=1 Tax=Apophysomyces ossiformis TaxID=679940 RepID=A0A8H7BUF7_9FUNG|nr:hypothetical protein EC973_005281 [Apophysomyces ossiformis]
MDIMEEMEGSRKDIPTAFQGKWRSLVGAARPRAVDWINFLLYVVPTLVITRIRTVEARNATIALVRGCQLALSYELSQDNVQDIESNINTWHHFLDRLTKGADKVLDISVFTPVQHYLSHIADIIRRLGPLRYFSARSLERTIGLYSRLFSSGSHPGQNAAAIMNKLAMTRHLRIEPEGANSEEFLSGTDQNLDDEELMEPELRGKLQIASLETMGEIATVSSQALRRALQCFYSRIGVSVAIEETFEYAGSLWHDHKVFGSLLQHKQGNRAAIFCQACYYN